MSKQEQISKSEQQQQQISAIDQIRAIFASESKRASERKRESAKIKRDEALSSRYRDLCNLAFDAIASIYRSLEDFASIDQHDNARIYFSRERERAEEKRDKWYPTLESQERALLEALEEIRKRKQ